MNLAAASYSNFKKGSLKIIFESLISIFWQKEMIP